MSTNNSQVFYLNWVNGGLTDIIYNGPFNNGIAIQYLPQKSYFVLETNLHSDKKIVFYGSSIDECKQWILNAGLPHKKYKCYDQCLFVPWNCLTTPIKINGIDIDYKMEKCFQHNNASYNVVNKLSPADLLPFIFNHANDFAREAWDKCFESNHIDLLILKSLTKEELIYFALTCENLKGFDTSLFTLVPGYVFQQKMKDVCNQPILMVIDDTNPMVIHPVLYKDTNDIRTYLNYSCNEGQVLKLLLFSVNKQFIAITKNELGMFQVIHENDTLANCKLKCNGRVDHNDYYIVDLMQFILPDNIFVKNQSFQYREQPKIEYTWCLTNDNVKKWCYTSK